MKRYTVRTEKQQYRHDQWVKNKATELEGHKRWAKKHPQAMKDFAKKHRDRNPDKRKADRDSKLKREYGITQADYDSMYEEQQGCCAICSKYCPVLHVDHNHETHNTRGLLCGNCNRGIGIMQDSPVLLRKAALYLETTCHEFLLLAQKEPLVENSVLN